jgi:hypothetical protein
MTTLDRNMKWREKFPVLDQHVNRLVTWTGFFSSVWAAMAWVASYVSPLSDYGWGTFVFVGLAACTFSLAISAALASWRYFSPLLPQPRADVISQTQEKPAPNRTSDAEIEKNRMKDSIRVISRTVGYLVRAEIERQGRSTIERLIEEQPKFNYDEDVSANNDLMKERTLELETYIRSVGAQLHNFRWGYEFDLAVQGAVADEDRFLRDNSRSMADGANAFLFREYCIGMAKRRRAIQFLETAVEDTTETERQLAPLI